MIDIDNIFEGIPNELPQELIEPLSEGKNISIERIVSRGHRSPKGFWYNQERDEFVILLSGSATIVFEEGKRELNSGDYCIIPAHCKHRVEETNEKENSVWLAVFFEKSPS